MKKGVIIYLNGVTSTGKTTLATAIQRMSDENFYAISNDSIADMGSRKFFETNYWQYLADMIVQGYHITKTLSDNGINVIFDGMVVERDEYKPHYENIKTIFKDSPLKMVEVFCPLDVCRARNIARGDRGPDQSDSQNKYMSKEVIHDIFVDTNANTPEECAAIILKEIRRG
jgi:Chloramphenicol 3-O-phosphotransferase